MYVSPDEFSNFWALPGRLVEQADKLLDMADRATDEQETMALIERSREVMGVARDIYALLDRVAQRNTTRVPSIANKLIGVASEPPVRNKLMPSPR